jgi:uncharacterized membrane protein (UPF0127 family)
MFCSLFSIASPLKMILRVFLTISCLIFITSLANKNLQDQEYKTVLRIKNSYNKKTNNFLVRIASSDAQKDRGLMWVENLPKNYGMVFNFDEERMVYMWMKNTKISLDMIFINHEGKVVNIYHQAVPESLRIISSIKPSSKVLEINGGLANILGIKVGDYVEIFDLKLAGFFL